ncbi:MBL fold metallo-hydrolase [Candidatus Halocynthiibacter alkanivorans]|uniref:MBL fold metallo-hydrolase n=1 Tax=Candidatus Halocynthiibacter alkanivorans TaxID=2267619 RepID=UPI000DF39A7A|nr:MBL fold metallo-hydrolase [Candidatus Halocynthiibacter alkanivorans]
MEDFTVLIGSKGGPAIRPGSSMPTSNLLRLGGRNIVVDCGLGVSAGVVSQGVSLSEIDLIVITHLHSDHYLELGPMIHTAWTAGLKQPLRVIGPAGLDAYWDGFLASMAFDIELRLADEGRPDLRALIEIEEITEGTTDLGGGLILKVMRNVHPPIDDSFALRFEAGEKAVVFSGDTAPMAEMAEFARGADLLVHEAMLLAAVDALCARVGNGDDRLKRHLLRSHSAVEEVARIATEAGVGALALNHLIPGDDPDFGPQHWHEAIGDLWRGPLHLGHDRLRIEI